MSVKGFFKTAYWFLLTLTVKQVPEEKVREAVLYELNQKGEIITNDILYHFDTMPVDPDTLVKSTNYLSMAKLYTVMHNMENQGLIRGETLYHPGSRRKRIHWTKVDDSL